MSDFCILGFCIQAQAWHTFCSLSLSKHLWNADHANVKIECKLWIKFMSRLLDYSANYG
jgi:hypothetical protein